MVLSGMARSKKVLIGRTGVDSGSIVITDPCYTADGSTAEQWKAQIRTKDGDSQLLNELGVPVGVWHATRSGYGIYPVYAHYDAEGQITKLSIEFQY